MYISDGPAHSFCLSAALVAGIEHQTTSGLKGTQGLLCPPSVAEGLSFPGLLIPGLLFLDVSSLEDFCFQTTFVPRTIDLWTFVPQRTFVTPTFVPKRTFVPRWTFVTRRTEASKSQKNDSKFSTNTVTMPIQNIGCYLQRFITFFSGRSGPGPLGPVRKNLVVRSGPEGPQFSRSVGTLVQGVLFLCGFHYLEYRYCNFPKHFPNI